MLCPVDTEGIGSGCFVANTSLPAGTFSAGVLIDRGGDENVGSLFTAMAECKRALSVSFVSVRACVVLTLADDVRGLAEAVCRGTGVAAVVCCGGLCGIPVSVSGLESTECVASVTARGVADELLSDATEAGVRGNSAEGCRLSDVEGGTSDSFAGGAVALDDVAEAETSAGFSRFSRCTI